jgi:hypothetical protein
MDGEGVLDWLEDRIAQVWGVNTMRRKVNKCDDA